MIKPWTQPLLIGLLVMLLYGLSMPIRCQDNIDALAELELAIRYERPLRPNHLVLTPTYRGILQLTAAAGLPGADFMHLQLANCLLGAASVGLLFLILRLHGCRLALCAAGSLLMAFANSHWLHSREAESAIFAHAFQMGAIALLTMLHGDRWQAGGRRIVVLAGLCFALSVLYAMNCVIILPACVLYAWFLAGKQHRWRAVFLFLSVAFIATFIPYLLAVWNVTGSATPSAVAGWVLHHPSAENLGAEMSEFSLPNLLRAASGLLNSFYGDSSVTTGLKMTLKGQEPIAIPAVDWLRFVLGAALALLLLLLSVRLPRGNRDRACLYGLIASLLAVGAFGVLWLGSDPQFWLPVIPFLILYPCRAVATGTGSLVQARTMRGAGCLFLVSLIALNLPYPTPTLTRPRGGTGWQRAVGFHAVTTAEDLLVYSSGWGKHLRAMGPHPIIDLVISMPVDGERFRAQLTGTIDGTLDQGGEVYALEVFEVHTSQAVGRWEEVTNRTGLAREGVVDLLRATYAVEPTERIAGEEGLWTIRRRE